MPFDAHDEERIRKRIAEADKIMEDCVRPDRLSPWTGYYWSDCLPMLAEVGRLRGELEVARNRVESLERVIGGGSSTDPLAGIMVRK